MRLPPVSDTLRRCPVQGLPTSPGTTGNAGPLPPYLLQETARGLMRGGGVPSHRAGHRAPGEGKGDGILDPVLEALQSAGAAHMGAVGIHRILPTCTVLPAWSPSIHSLAGVMKLISMQALLMRIL